jgi:alpha-glucosidase (family GH31 glycosyl hydrolase)
VTVTSLRHRPWGRGHGYLPSLDQRTPVYPVTGERVVLGVLGTPEMPAPAVEVVADGIVTVHSMTAVQDTSADRQDADGDGHLAAAAQAGEDVDGLVAWTSTIGPFDAPGVVRYRFRAADERETSIWYEVPVGQWMRSGGELRIDGDESHVIAGSTSFLISAGRPIRARFGLRLAPDEHVVGRGERFHALDQRGWAVDATVFEQYRNQGTRTYLPVPFGHVVGGAGWGFHVDTTRRVWFDVGASDPGVLWVEARLGLDAPELTVHLWDGTPSQVLDHFFDRVGRPASVPDWAFRPWISSNEWNTQQRVESEVDRSLTEGIPVGAVVIEAWSDEGTIYIWRDAEYQPATDGGPLRLSDFRFPPDGAWPDPMGMVQRLHRNGVRVILWQIPLIPDHDLDLPQLRADRAALIGRGYAVQEDDGSPYRNRGWWFPRALLPDFTSAEVRRWWTAKRRYLLEDMGIDGFKTDGGEHAWGDELRYADGSRGDESNNRFPNLYAQAFHDLITSTGTAGLTFSRAGHAGAGSFPAHWAGDEQSTWAAFRASIMAGISAGASGVFLWSWDHGGFSGPLPSAELYLRTAAMACFCPIMQYHAEFNAHRVPSRDRTPWNVAEQTGDPAVLPVYRKFARRRDRLVPYLAEQARRSIEGSVPLMRALMFDWPHDERIWDFPLQYLLGDHLLVAPVTAEGASTWRVYLPAGDWVDVWTGRAVTGNTVLTRDVPIDVIPVYCRAAAWPALAPMFRPPAENRVTQRAP